MYIYPMPVVDISHLKSFKYPDGLGKIAAEIKKGGG